MYIRTSTPTGELRAENIWCLRLFCAHLATLCTSLPLQHTSSCYGTADQPHRAAAAHPRAAAGEARDDPHAAH